MKMDVRNESLALLSPKTEQHEIFPCNGSMRYKTEWDTEVNFDFLFFSLLIFTEFYYHESVFKYVIPKNYTKIFGVFLANF